MNRKMFIFKQSLGLLQMRWDDVVDQLVPPEEGKQLSELSVGEYGWFKLRGSDGSLSHEFEVLRGGDDNSISYGPFLTAKQYGSAMLHLMQAFEDIRLAAHYLEEDPPVGQAVKLLGSKIAEMHNQLSELKTKAETPQPTKAI